jgi:hypothetical protein
MWDALRHSYRFRCPDGAAGRGPVKLSAFRSVTRLDGPAHPAVFRVVHACTVCGGEHSALAPHDELDHAPLAATVEISFWNPMTGRVEGDLGHELSQAAADRLRRGQWPLSFWCSSEQRLRPAYPSSLRFVAKHDRLVGVAVTCTSCGEDSLNLVSERHLDEPFFHDPVVHSLERPVGDLGERDRFQWHLGSSRFDAHGTDQAA